ncbi:atypical membrane-integrating protein (Mistic protein) [Bacillus lacus]|uniref:Atypical membrane-integrating protein (Mistic protein) n=1 Tax=Metabacillus lacus TaxID=1983721 RepID=A0A7X2J0I9_9BACI|nr:atypical membrane-integrating protein (Mistic protein) [Metabacillus lacus]MRX73120.1 atypical membrane-integrating protein (Mistic protein) [Metabacillus lacus]
MKLTEEEKSSLSEAIDRMNEGLDAFIQYYNESEEDKPLIEFSEETQSAIHAAVSSYGKEEVEKRINNIIKEIFSFLPPHQGDENNEVK